MIRKYFLETPNPPQLELRYSFRIKDLVFQSSDLEGVIYDPEAVINTF